MRYDTKGELVDGGIHTVDDAPKHKLGKTVLTDDGKTFVYIKASAALAAGTAYKVSPAKVSTATCSTDGQISITATAPTIITSVKGGDLDGALVKLTRDGTVVGAYPIISSTDNGTAITAMVPEAKASDTVAGIESNTPAFCGGDVASGKTAGIPVVAIASGKYGWVLMQDPLAPSA